MSFTDYWIIFSISFTVALSGACSPGPLLTYTVIKSMQPKGYLMGLLIITGHAILETIIIALLLFGFSFILKHPVVVLMISMAGGAILITMGIQILITVFKGKVTIDFLTPSAEQQNTLNKKLNNPVIGGILVSMSNPYWWVWWATLGFSLMLQLKISFRNPGGLFAFFLGHEVGDLAWYVPVSVLVFLGRKKINKQVYTVILLLCAAAIIGFGLFLSISAILKGDYLPH